MNKELYIKEIYKTLQGEGPSTGRPVTLLRLSGCSLRCVYCDSEYAFEGGEQLSIDSILNKLKELGNQLVLVTGGEPLDQEACTDLLESLLTEGYEIELETAGHKSLAEIPSGVRILMDVKSPDSGMQKHFVADNLNCLDENDILKFVLASKEDYDWAKDFINSHKENIKAEVWFSPCSNANPKLKGLEAQTLATWMVEDSLPVRFQLQLHKIIWGKEISR